MDSSDKIDDIKHNINIGMEPDAALRDTGFIQLIPGSFKYQQAMEMRINALTHHEFGIFAPEVEHFDKCVEILIESIAEYYMHRNKFGYIEEERTQ